jgi:hypothetical protein
MAKWQKFSLSDTFQIKLTLQFFKISISSAPDLGFRPGTDVMVFKDIFAEKFSGKIGVFDSKQS